MDNEKNMTVSEAAKLLNYKSNQGLMVLIDLKIFPNAYKKGGQWRIPASDIEEVKKIFDNTLTTSEVKKRLGFKSTISIVEHIEKSLFPNAFRFLRKWRIPLADIEKFENMKKSQELDLTTTQVAEKLRLSRNSILALIQENKFPNAYKDYTDKWRIPVSDLKYFQESEEHIKFKSKVRPKRKGEIKPYSQGKRNYNAVILWKSYDIKGYKSLIYASEKLSLSERALLKILQKELPNGLMKYRKKYWVSKSKIDNYLTLKLKEIESSLTPKEVAKRLGHNHLGNISRLIKDGRLPNAFKVGKKSFIPIKDIEQYEHEKEEKYGRKDYTPKDAYLDIEKLIIETKIDSKIMETKNLFREFVFYKINNTKGSISYLRGRMLLYQRFYTKLIQNLSDEIFNFSADDINKLLQETSIFNKIEKKVLIVFLRYVYHQKEMTPDSEFLLTTDYNLVKEKEIYPLELFNKIYKYAKNIEIHVTVAVKKRSYANMWTYTILLLTDFIRGQDLILNTPQINLMSIGITSIDFFNDNKLTETQIELVIKQVYVHFRNKRSSKTDELLTFIVSPDLKEALAHSLIISEFHRRQDKSELMLDTFLQGKYSAVKTAGKISHKHFFDKLEKNFNFSSRKMNNSVATYLFYSIVEEDGQDSDLALHLTQVSRSHKNSDSTSRYIQATNKDGSINRVSYNLFRRGHFGWLYNYLSIYLNQDESAQATLEERTQIIEEIRDSTSPKLLESLAIYSLQSTMPVKENNQTMKKFTQDLYEKRKNIISRLQDYSKNEVREILYKMSKGDLPSKNEHAQCLVAPSCVKPHLSNCFSCEYVIPGNMILIQLQEEIQRLIKNIKEATTDIEVKRDTKFLLHSLMIWKEARVAYGDDTVNAYIPSESVWSDIHSIADKLVLK